MGERTHSGDRRGMMIGWVERHAKPLLLLSVAAGIGERALWNVVRPTAGAAGEAMNVAVAVGSGRGFADAYQVGQGATAHLMPFSPGLAGGVYALLGVRSFAAEFVLATWAIGLAIGTYLLLFRAFGRIGTPLWARLVALGFACVAPTYVGQEAVDFRVWEGGLAVFLTALLLDRLFAAITQPPGPREIGGVAALCSFLFFVNPLVGLAAFAVTAVFALRTLRWPQTALAVGVSSAVLAVLLVPWTVRNAHALGTPVMLRSNLGIELALANYPGAVADGDRKQQFMDRLTAIHPVVPASYSAMVASGGEVAYSKKLKDQTQAWMAAHPGEVVRLVLRHVRQTILPETWQFDVFGKSLPPLLRSMLADGVGLFGLAGLMTALAMRRRNWDYILIFVVLTIGLASLFQPVTRYTYLLYPIMVFSAFDLLGTIARRFWQTPTGSTGH